MAKHIHISQLIIVLVQFLASIVGIAGGKVPAIIVFGDSSVDSGNNNGVSTLLKSNFSPYGRDFIGGKATGRFCNGRIPTDFISEGFGLKPTVPAYLDPMYNISDFATGVCFASAGTGYDSATSDVLSVIPFMKQLEYYKEYQTKLKGYAGENKAQNIIKESLHLISLGTNDFLENYYLLPTRRSQFTVDRYQDYLLAISENFMKTLSGLGARKISITGLPPMGCLPLERTANYLQGGGDKCIASYNDVSVSFNDKLQILVDKLNLELPGVKTVFSNVFYILRKIIQKPALFGFEASAVACCSTGLYEMGYLCNEHNPLTCSDANKYVFWDAFHPTEKTNKIVSDYGLQHALRAFM